MTFGHPGPSAKQPETNGLWCLGLGVSDVLGRPCLRGRRFPFSAAFATTISQRTRRAPRKPATTRRLWGVPAQQKQKGSSFGMNSLKTNLLDSQSAPQDSLSIKNKMCMASCHPFGWNMLEHNPRNVLWLLAMIILVGWPPCWKPPH